MNRPLFLLLVLFLAALPCLGQPPCGFCKSTVEVVSLPYREGDLSVCAKCRRTLPPCDLCHQPCPGPAYRDQRHICPSCRKTGIFDKGRVAVLAGQIQSYMVSQLGPEARSLPPIQLVDQDELQTKFNESGRAVAVVAFYRPYNPEMVYLLSGETELNSCGHLVHELTHAWQSRTCQAQDRALSEGFACWVQYQYLMSRGAQSEAQALTHHQDPDYGASLVVLLRRSSALGKERFLSAVKKARRLSDV